jgi:hypothetical protein
MSVESGLRACALAAAVTVVGMIGIFFVLGVGQDPLQYVHPAAEYSGILLKSPGALRAAIGLDDLFIVLYSSAFVLLATRLLRDGTAPALVWVPTVLLLGLAGLDMVENFHFLAMIARAELGLVPTDTEIELQVWESLVKFHVGYLGLFLLGFALPWSNVRARWLARLGWLVQLPVGVLIYVTPSFVAFPLVFVRFAYFVTALVLLAFTFSDASDSSAPE